MNKLLLEVLASKDRAFANVKSGQGSDFCVLVWFSLQTFTFLRANSTIMDGVLED